MTNRPSRPPPPPLPPPIHRNGVGVTLGDLFALRDAGFVRLIPIEPGTKQPPKGFSWSDLQDRPATVDALREAFSGNGTMSVAIVLGHGLLARDYDDPAEYARFTAEHPDLAKRCQTVKTPRGFHVYARTTPEAYAQVRRALGKRQGNGAIKVNGGELRGGPGCYCVAPPSKGYHWLNHPRGKVPKVADLPLIEDLTVLCGRATQAGHKGTQAYSGVLKLTQEDTGHGVCGGCFAQSFTGTSRKSLPDPWPEEFDRVIQQTLPQRPGKRHEQVFQLCRHLQDIECLEGYHPRDLKPLVQEWHRRALPHISTKPFDETWVDFLQAWPNVKHKISDGTLRRAWEAAAVLPLPAIAAQFEEPHIQRLVGLCRELQRQKNGEPFFLSCRSAAQLLGVNHSSVSRWLFLLVAEEILQPVTKGTIETMKASEFFYLYPLDEPIA